MAVARPWTAWLARRLTEAVDGLLTTPAGADCGRGAAAANGVQTPPKQITSSPTATSEKPDAGSSTAALVVIAEEADNGEGGLAVQHHLREACGSGAGGDGGPDGGPLPTCWGRVAPPARARCECGMISFRSAILFRRITVQVECLTLV